MMGELVEEGVFAVVGGPNGEIEAPGDAGLGGLPEDLGVRVLGEFVEADVAAIDGHGLGAGGEGDDTGAVGEFDVADFDFVGEGRGFAVGIEAADSDEVFAVRNHVASDAEKFGEFEDLAHVFERTGPIFGGEEVIAFSEAESFADIFEGVGKSPADANGFFGEGDDLLFALMERVFGENPGELVGGEVAGDEGVGVEVNGGEDGGHRREGVEGSGFRVQERWG